MYDSKGLFRATRCLVPGGWGGARARAGDRGMAEAKGGSGLRARAEVEQLWGVWRPQVCAGTSWLQQPQGEVPAPLCRLAQYCLLGRKVFWKCNWRWQLCSWPQAWVEAGGRAGSTVRTGAAWGPARLAQHRGRRWPGGQQQLRIWPDFDGLGSALMFHLETARLG